MAKKIVNKKINSASVVTPISTVKNANTQEISVVLPDVTNLISSKTTKSSGGVGVPSVAGVGMSETNYRESNEIQNQKFTATQININNVSNDLTKEVSGDDASDVQNQNETENQYYYMPMKHNGNKNCVHNFFTFFNHSNNLINDRIKSIQENVNNIKLYDELISVEENNLINMLYTNPVLSVKNLDVDYPNILVDWNSNEESIGKVSSDITIDNTYIYISSLEPIENNNINIYAYLDNDIPFYTINHDGTILLNNSTDNLHVSDKSFKIKFESSNDNSIYSEIYAYNIAKDIKLLSNKDYSINEEKTFDNTSFLIANPIYNRSARFNENLDTLIIPTDLSNSSKEITLDFNFIPDKNDYPENNSKLSCELLLCSDITSPRALEIFNDLGKNDVDLLINDADFYALKFAEGTARNKKPRIAINQYLKTLTLKFHAKDKQLSLDYVLDKYYEETFKKEDAEANNLFKEILTKKLFDAESNVGFVLVLTNKDKNDIVVSKSFIKIKPYDKRSANTLQGTKINSELCVKEQDNPGYPLKFYKINLTNANTTPVLIYSAEVSAKNNGLEKPKIKLSSDRTTLYVLPYGTSKEMYVNVFYNDYLSNTIVRKEITLENPYTESFNLTDSTLHNLTLTNDSTLVESKRDSKSEEIILDKIYLEEQYDEKYYLPFYTYVEYNDESTADNKLNSSCISKLNFKHFDNFEKFYFGSIEVALNKEIFYNLYGDKHTYNSEYVLPIKLLTVTKNDVLANEINLTLTNIGVSDEAVKNSTLALSFNGNVISFKYAEIVDDNFIYEYKKSGSEEKTILTVKENIYFKTNGVEINKENYEISGLTTENVEDAKVNLIFADTSESSISIIAEDEENTETVEDINAEKTVTDTYSLTTYMYKPTTRKKRDIVNTSINIKLFENGKQIDIDSVPSISNSMFKTPSQNDAWIMNIRKYDKSQTESKCNEYNLKFVPRKVGLVENIIKDVDIYINDIAGFDITLNIDFRKLAIVKNPYESFNITSLRTEEDAPEIDTNYYAFKLNSITGYANDELFATSIEKNVITLIDRNSFYSVVLDFDYETIDEIDEDYSVKIPESFEMPIAPPETVEGEVQEETKTTGKIIGEGDPINLRFDIQYANDLTFGNFKMPFLQELMNKWPLVKNDDNSILAKTKKFFAFNNGENLIEITDETSAAEIYNALSKEKLSEVSSIRFYEGRIIPKVRTKNDFVQSLNKAVSMQIEDATTHNIAEAATNADRNNFPLGGLQSSETKITDANGVTKTYYTYDFDPSKENEVGDITKKINDVDRTKVGKIQNVISDILARNIDPDVLEKELTTAPEENKTPNGPLYEIKSKLVTFNGLSDLVFNLSDDDFDELIRTVSLDDEAKIGNPIMNVFFIKNTGGLDKETVDFIKNLKIKSLNDFGKIENKQVIPSRLQKMWNNDWFYNRPSNIFSSNVTFDKTKSFGLMNDKFIMLDLNKKDTNLDSFYGKDYKMIKTLSWVNIIEDNPFTPEEEYTIKPKTISYNYLFDNSKRYIGSMLNNAFYDYLSNIFTYDYSSPIFDVKDITKKYVMKYIGDETDEKSFNKLLADNYSETDLMFDYKNYDTLISVSHESQSTPADIFVIDSDSEIKTTNLTYSYVTSILNYWKENQEEITYIYNDNLRKYDDISNIFLKFEGNDEKLLQQDLLEYSKYVLYHFNSEENQFGKNYIKRLTTALSNEINPNNNFELRQTYLNSLMSNTLKGVLNYFPEINGYIYDICLAGGLFNNPEIILTDKKYDLVNDNEIAILPENIPAEKMPAKNSFDYLYDENNHIIGVRKQYNKEKNFKNTTYYVGSFDETSKNAYICKTNETPAWDEKSLTYKALRISPTGNLIKYKYDATDLSKYNNYYKETTNKHNLTYIYIVDSPSIRFYNDNETTYAVGSVNINDENVFENSFIYRVGSKPKFIYDGYGDVSYFYAYEMNNAGNLVQTRFTKEEFFNGKRKANKYNTDFYEITDHYIVYPCSTNSFSYMFDAEKYFIHSYIGGSYLYKIHTENLQNCIDIHKTCINLHLLNMYKNAYTISVLDNMHDINAALTAEKTHTYSLDTCYTNSYVLYDKRTYFDADGTFGEFNVTYVDVNLDFTYSDNLTGYTYLSYQNVVRVNIPRNTYILPNINISKFSGSVGVVAELMDNGPTVTIAYNAIYDESHYGYSEYPTYYTYTYLWNNNIIDFEIKLPIISKNTATITLNTSYVYEDEKTYHPYTFDVTPRIWISTKYEYSTGKSGIIGVNNHEFGLSLTNAPCGRVPWSYIYNENIIGVKDLNFYNNIKDYKETDFSGSKNTENILYKVKSKALFDAPAARHAKHYLMPGKTDYTQQIFNFYLGDVSEWQVIADNIELINTYLTYVGGETLYDGSFKTDLPEKKWFWTSSEIDDNTAWTTSLTESSLEATNKNMEYYVRPLFKANTALKPENYFSILINDGKDNKVLYKTIKNIDENKIKKSDETLIKEISSVYVALFIYVLDKNPYGDGENNIFGIDEKKYAFSNIHYFVNNMDEYLQFFENIALHKLVKIVKYDELIYDYETVTNEINKIILSVQKDEITVGGKYLVSIPFFIYTSLGSVNIDNKYTLISSTAADGIYRPDTLVGTTLKTNEFKKLYPNVQTSFDQPTEVANVYFENYDLISPTRKIYIKVNPPSAGEIEELFKTCKSIMFVKRSTNFIFYYTKVISAKKLEDEMYDYEYELPNFRNDELIINAGIDMCYVFDSYVETKFTGYDFETIKKYLPETYKHLVLQYNSGITNNSYFTEFTDQNNNNTNQISGITIFSKNELNFTFNSTTKTIYRSLIILDSKNTVKYFENISNVNDITKDDSIQYKYEITLNYSINVHKLSLNKYKCILFSFYVPNNITKIIKDNEYWLEDVNDCQIIKELINNEKIVIEGNEYKTQLAIPLDYFKNNPAQDNVFTTELSGENILGRDPLKMFIQERNDLIKQLNLPKLSTIALKINGSYLKDFNIQNYKYEKLIEEHIKDLIDLP